ncbi:PHD finger protein 20 isoform X1 [Takifugu rubripes]|uniref:PHD finger protein 20, a n=2 Tax=Takifugu rubripes TaxID=31033 RepID=H2TNS6_TAKRU|nr:PHD finger protein 20 isoform X1 [Takifugu rubripes]|eukprot:XP_011612614.1 PREDICTED: PHD finger protein 20 isoform X1 [Takifugu rubripes]
MGCVKRQQFPAPRPLWRTNLAAPSTKDRSLDVGSMNKTPPTRSGITFEVGAQLEARDSLKNWYAANIEKIDYEEEKVLIHYRQWSHRYDEWFDWASPYLRPVERVQPRRKSLNDDPSMPGFHVNDKVLASWSDCRFYPAKVIAVNKDASYTVRFYDGVIQKVKGIHVKPFIKEKAGFGGGKSTERNMVRRGPNRRDRRSQENGGPKNKRARRRTSDQEEETYSEDEECDDMMLAEKNKKANGEVLTPPTVKQEEEMEQTVQNQPAGTENGLEFTNGVKMEDDEQNKKRYPMNGDVKKELVSDASGTKPYSDSSAPAELPMHKEQVSVSMTTTASSGEVEQKPNIQSESSRPAEDVPPPQPVKPVRKQGFHNPNRFSREPLYRVIKNQPPPVLSINLDHNPFKCSAPGCTKSFRKAKLLHYHMKYYHGDEHALEEERSPTRSVQTRASDKQVSGLDGPKRRRTISASMHSVGAMTAARGEVKTAGRRVSAPPMVNSHGQQRALLREKSKENQLDRNGCQQQDRDSDKGCFEVGSAKEKLKEKPKQKDFLRIKLKKKRRRRKKAKFDYTGSEENIDISVLGLQSKLNLPFKHPPTHSHKPEAYARRPGYSCSDQIHVDDEDSFSDWSTDSCGWSDEDCGVDLDFTTPPLSVDSGAVDTSDQEIVRCICEVEEENDFMIQCEDCLCWQHGTCMGLLEDNVPDRYTCYICRDPPGQRQSLRYWYDREWLSNGHMYGLSFLEENYSHQNAKKITTTHQLLGDVHHLVEVLNGLQLKMSVLQSNTHPDLQLWQQPWKHLERSWKRADSCHGSESAPSPVTPDEDMTRGEILMSNALERLSRAATSTSTSSMSSSSSPYTSFQNSYITSEHCYQKPRAYYPAVEQRLVVETRQGSELEDSMRSTEELLEREQRYGSLLETEKSKPAGTTNKALISDSRSQTEIKEEEGRKLEVPDNNCRQHQQRQINLLDHIDAVQDEVSHRMDFIERELDVLESWMDYTGELEPPEPLSRLPQLKHRMKRLLTQLGKVQQISLYSST